MFDARRVSTAAMTLALGCTLGCHGAIMDEGGEGEPSPGATPAPPKPGGTGGAGGAGGTPAVDGLEACGPSSGAAPLRRLTRDEYNNTVADLLGDTTRPAVAFVPDDKIGAFDGNATTALADLALEQYWTTARSLAARAVQTRLTELLPCDPTGAEESCARKFVTKLGARAYRRPLAAGEIDALVAAYRTGRMQGDFANGIRLALQSILASPFFLYHVESGRPGAGTAAGVALTDHEVAARLSYYMWGSLPDAKLTEAADAGKLRDAKEVEAQARRLMADPRAEERLRAFHHGWLGLGEITDRRVLNNGFVASAKADLLDTVMDVLNRPDGSVSALFTTDVAFVDATLAPYYGLPAAQFTKTAQRTVLTQPERRGLLARVGSLLTHGTPSSRGKFIRGEVLCQPVPDPPSNVDTTLPDPVPGEAPRARWLKHIADPSCGGCHKLIDPIGFGLAQFDDMGRFRTEEGGFPIETAGELVNVEGVTGGFSGPHELQEQLGRSANLRECMAHQWFTFAYARTPTAEDACTLRNARKIFEKTGENVRELMVALATAEAFRMLKVDR